jgi:predicted ATPase/DNA-binding SARP family transcriptional activator/Tfp pilus assembly protein PilF
MAAPITLQLFGVPTLLAGDGGAALVFTIERPFQLLAFLAFRQQWVRRDEISALLWPDRDAGLARSNLRKVLLVARKLPGIGDIAQERDLLRWAPRTDLRAFEEACEADRFDDAAALFNAPLLEGMELGFGADGREWIAFERERVQAQWHAFCLRRLDLAASDPAEAMRIAEAMHRRDPLDEVAVCALARAQHARGLRAGAAATLERYAKRLADELALEPTSAWHEALRTVRADAQPVAAANRVQAAHEDFVGRRNELAQMRQLLAQPACRLLTLVGFAGTGKSATARKAAEQRIYGDDAVWVPLADLTSPSQLGARIASALGIELAGADDIWPQIEGAIGDRAMLLVLDNAEHLALGADLERLLDACPRLKLLVTSRERLRVKGEWLLPLDGLPLPDEDESDVEVLRHCDAVQLFETRARPFSPAFDLARHAVAVARLVRLVGGSPLAIELAAAWTRVMPVDDIAAELARSLDLLESGEPAERGLGAGFEQAWQRLAPAEQALLARLAVLPGDFGRAMAVQVASASLPLLAALVDKALLRCDEAGRFSMHPLIRERAAMRATDAAQVLAAHARHVGAWVVRYGESWREMGRAALNEMDRELAHLRVAWTFACEHRDGTLVTSMARALGRYYETRGLWKEGLAAFANAAHAFDAGEARPADARARACILRAWQTLQYRNGRLLEAEASAQRLLEASKDLADSTFRKAAFNTLGLCLWQRGEFDQAKSWFERAAEVAKQDGIPEERALFDSNIAMVDKALGRYDDALARYVSVLEARRERNDVDGVVTALNNMANIHRVREQHAEALHCLEEALDLCTRERLAAARPFVLVNLGLTCDELGRSDEAADWLQRAVDEARASGEPNIEASALLGQADRDARARSFADARAKVALALDIADRLPSAGLQVQCVLAYGEIVAAEGDAALGAGLLRWGIEQPALNRADRDRAQRKLARIEFRAPRAIPPGEPLRAVLTLVPQR